MTPEKSDVKKLQLHRFEKLRELRLLQAEILKLERDIFERDGGASWLGQDVVQPCW